MLSREQIAIERDDEHGRAGVLGEPQGVSDQRARRHVRGSRQRLIPQVDAVDEVDHRLERNSRPRRVSGTVVGNIAHDCEFQAVPHIGSLIGTIPRSPRHTLAPSVRQIRVAQPGRWRASCDCPGGAVTNSRHGSHQRRSGTPAPIAPPASATRSDLIRGARGSAAHPLVPNVLSAHAPSLAASSPTSTPTLQRSRFPTRDSRQRSRPPA